MNEQTILLIFLVAALAVTLGLYFLKAKKQMQYKGDERWKLIQLNANNAANISNAVLIVLLVVLPLFIDSQTTFTLQRVITLNWLQRYILTKNCKEDMMFTNRKVVRGIILAVLLLCTAYLVYSIIANPLGEHDIILALAVTAGFIALSGDKKKDDKS